MCGDCARAKQKKKGTQVPENRQGTVRFPLLLSRGQGGKERFAQVNTRRTAKRGGNSVKKGNNRSFQELSPRKGEKGEALAFLARLTRRERGGRRKYRIEKGKKPCCCVLYCGVPGTEESAGSQGKKKEKTTGTQVTRERRNTGIVCGEGGGERRNALLAVGKEGEKGKMELRKRKENNAMMSFTS